MGELRGRGAGTGPLPACRRRLRPCPLGPSAGKGKSGKGDFNRRTSSGNWVEDKVTWKEEQAYKKAMGFICESEDK